MMQNINLCDFVTKYGLCEIDNLLIKETYSINDCVGEIIDDDPLFNVYGMMYAMRELLFLFNPHDIHKMAEYMFDFGINNPNALKYNLFHPNNTVPSNKSNQWQNPYYKNTEFLVNESKTIEYYKLVLDKQLIERHFYNSKEFSNALEKLSIEVFGNPYMKCPVLESIERASEIRSKMMLDDINILNEIAITGDLTQKYNMLHDIVCNSDTGDQQTKYKILTPNLLCIFNMDEFVKQRERLRSIVIMNPLKAGFELFYPSWEDFTNWLKINKADVKEVCSTYNEMYSNNLVGINGVSRLTPRQMSLFTALKFMLGDFQNNPVRAGMTQEEINKNYNRQKIYNNVESLLKVVSGANT